MSDTSSACVVSVERTETTTSENNGTDAGAGTGAGTPVKVEEIEIEPQPQPVTETITDTEPQPVTETVSQPQSVTHPVGEIETETVPETQPVVETETETAAQPVVETEKATQSIVETEKATQPITETEKATQPITETEIATQPVIQQTTETAQSQSQISIQIHPHDVLSIRGKSNHPGNLHFNDLVRKNALTERHKNIVAQEIVRGIMNKDRNPPGRFLRKDEKSGQWYGIDYYQALQRTKIALTNQAKWAKARQHREKCNVVGIVRAVLDEQEEEIADHSHSPDRTSVGMNKKRRIMTNNESGDGRLDGKQIQKGPLDNSEETQLIMLAKAAEQKENEDDEERQKQEQDNEKEEDDDDMNDMAGEQQINMVTRHNAIMKRITHINHEIHCCNNKDMRSILLQRAKHDALTDSIAQARFELGNCGDDAEMKAILRGSVLDMMRKRADLARIFEEDSDT